MTKLLRVGKSSPSVQRRPVIDQQLRTLLDTNKKDTRLLGDIQRLLLRPGENNGRRQDVLHPSELAHSDWCPRATYFRLAGVKPTSEPTATHWQLQMIFDEGTDIHTKWQKRIWDVGHLGGSFYCTSCHYAWGAIAPTECENCHADRQFLRYHEVPLHNLTLTMAGHADGTDRDEALIEIKSVGLGTLRYEAPNLIAKHTYQLNINGRSREFIDYDALWDNIRTPFPSHVRQGDLYCFMSRRYTEVIFLYESKWNQKVKEMVVRYRKERIEERLDQCAQITLALQGGNIPACPFDGCADCQRYEETASANTGRRILVRRSPAPTPKKTDPQPTRDSGQNGQRPQQRRLQRLGDRARD